MSDVWKGIAMPWGQTLESFIDPKDDQDVLKSSILFIITTRRGERVMMPSFGSGLMERVFEPGDSVLISNLESDIMEAVALWDDRINFVDMSIEITDNFVECKVIWKNAKDPLEVSNQTLEFSVPLGLTA